MHMLHSSNKGHHSTL